MSMTFDPTQPWTGRVPASTVCRNPDQPRVSFDKAGLNRLAAAMRKRQQQPCRVIPHRDEHRPQIQWMLVDGERRWRAATEADLDLWICYEPGVTHDNLHESSLAANFNREGHTKMDTARALQKELDDGKTQEELAELVGWSVTNVSNYLALLKLHPDLQALLDHKEKSRRIAMSVAVALTHYPKEKQRALFEQHAQGQKPGDALMMLRASSSRPISTSRTDDNRFFVGRLRTSLVSIKNLGLLQDMVSRITPDRAAEALLTIAEIQKEIIPIKTRLEKLITA